ncbi:MAG: fumarylacetoacetate hydrolase family protein [Paludibacteraceae bacterium]|nr:fumarylacetoacetate hydrolase family protein [Paludibacteraceae bacterium]
MKIFCIGWNYPQHNSEMRRADLPSEPTLFMKPDTALLRENKPFFLPHFSNQMEHEVEVIVRINRVGRNIQERFAPRYYSEIGLGVDFTARDLQNRCKEKGQPWEIAKAFDNSAVVSEFVPLAEFGKEIQNLNFELWKNGELQQRGCTGDMLFTVNKIIEYISSFFTLKVGDIIFTGTPAGVSKVAIDDHLVGQLEGREMFNFYVK